MIAGHQMPASFARRLILAICICACSATRAAMIPTAPVPSNQDDSLGSARRALADEVMRQIAGNENEPATTVFKNVKALTFGVSALQLVRAMDQGFGRSLGVGCDHCHVVGQWDSDSLRPKRIAREMIRLNGTINIELSKIKDFEGPVGASCWTCHRGSTRPARAPA